MAKAMSTSKMKLATPVPKKVQTKFVQEHLDDHVYAEAQVMQDSCISSLLQVNTNIADYLNRLQNDLVELENVLRVHMPNSLYQEKEKDSDPGSESPFYVDPNYDSPLLVELVTTLNRMTSISAHIGRITRHVVA